MLFFLSLVLNFFQVVAAEIPTPDLDEPLMDVLIRSAVSISWDGRIGVCSGSLVQFEGLSDSQPALVVTNGHCINEGSIDVYGVRMPAIGEILIDIPTSAHIFLSFGRLQAERLLVGTMTRTDIAIYQLHLSYKELIQIGAQPLRVNQTETQHENEQVWVVSHLLRTISPCLINGIDLSIQEDQWVLEGVLGLVGESCQLIPGMSGSPVVNRNGQLIGVVSTSNEGGKDCSLDNPCEIQADGGRKSFDSKNYAVSITQLNQCVINGVFQPQSENCPLRPTD